MTIAAGGPHVKHYTASLARKSCFDFLVTDDGEAPLAAIARGEAASRVIADKAPRWRSEAYPRPDRSSADAAALLRRYSYAIGGRRSTTMMTARGCPEQCTFCEDAMTPTRPSSLRKICDELDDIVNLGYGGVYIFDDLFALSVKRIRPICDALQHRDLVYRCNAQARYFTRWGDEMARVLSDTGCHEIAFGAESGSQRMLDTVKKRCTVKQNYDTVAFAKRYGLKVKAFILLGLPGEDDASLADTERFIKTAGIDDFQCAIYMPYKGTQIRRQLDDGEPIDLRMSPGASDGEITGAYGVKGGETSAEVRTAALSEARLKAFRDYLVSTYRPTSHLRMWRDDQFFDTHLAGVEATC